MMRILITNKTIRVNYTEDIWDKVGKGVNRYYSVKEF